MKEVENKKKDGKNTKRNEEGLKKCVGETEVETVWDGGDESMFLRRIIGTKRISNRNVKANKYFVFICLWHPKAAAPSAAATASAPAVAVAAAVSSRIA